MVQHDEVKNLMDQMMEVPIFLPADKRRMLNDESNHRLDPNLIMDARHRLFRESLPIWTAKCSVLDEARRLLSDEEAKELYLKKEQEYLERQLEKFEKELCKSRPKFQKVRACSRRNFASSDDEDFWRASSRAKIKNNKIGDHGARPLKRSETEPFVEEPDSSSNGRKGPAIAEALDTACVNSIKITIKDKPSCESEEQRLEMLRACLDALKRHARDERRLRDVKTKIQERSVGRRLREYFDKWRACVDDRKNAVREEKSKKETLDEKKIDMFVNLITEKQRELIGVVKTAPRSSRSAPGSTESAKGKNRKAYGKRVLYDSPAQSRLNAQKMIIERQRAKLAEQNRIIEELSLKRVQEEISRSSKDTVNVAKESLVHCGRATRRTLVQLMRQAGYRDRSLESARRVPSPPRFLLRMEARAAARKERIRSAEETRRKRAEERRNREEAARREEEQERRRLQQEASRRARRLREEQELARAREAERSKKSNETADQFYRRYLLRRYVMEPFKELVEIRNNYAERADRCYDRMLLRRPFAAWKSETDRQSAVKTEAAVLLCNRNLTWYAFRDWREMAKETSRMYQVASDFADMRIQEEYFKEWRVQTAQLKRVRLENEQLARDHYRRKLKIEFLRRWRRYPEIAEEVKEIERRRNKWREIVQKIIPDFDPKTRGVALDD